LTGISLEQGFKTVFVLRLSPVLPIPIAAYSYLYGATSLSVPDFLLGTALGSVKPYALDTYLGLVGKDILNEASGLPSLDRNDAVLLAAFAVFVLVGGLATQIATRTWEEMQKELESSSAEGSSLGGKDFMESDLDFLKVLAIDDNKLPGWIRGLKDGLGSAWLRVDTVLRDEYIVLKAEVEQGKQVDSLVGWNGVREPGSEGLYPGDRAIQPYELDRPNADNVLRFTAESLVFSFVLISGLLRLLSNKSAFDV